RNTILFNMIKEIINIATIWPSPFAFMCPVNLTWNISNISILFNQRKSRFIKNTFPISALRASSIIMLIQPIYDWPCPIIKHLLFR
ncbi:hypothetical protein SEEH3374_13621, partial [Salmonella enterica subsp. enterica serovar Heidelberg str. RI-11-013374]